MEKIICKIIPTEVNKLKSLLRGLEESTADLEITRLISGNLGDDLVISFNSEQRFQRFIIEKLVLNDFQVLPTDQLSKIYVEKAQEKANSAKSQGYSGYSTGQTENKAKRKSDVEKSLNSYIENGEYEKVIAIARDVSYGTENVEKAKTHIDKAVNIAINNAFNLGYQKKYESENSIHSLINIAADNSLRALQKNDEILNAGERAIQLCEKYRENLDILLKIINNNKLPNLLNVKAAIKFAEKVFENDSLLEDELDYATRTLNIRWLRIAIDVVAGDIGRNESILLNRLIAYIQEHR